MTEKKYSGVQVLKMVRSALDGALQAVDDYNQEIINVLEEALKKDVEKDAEEGES